MKFKETDPLSVGEMEQTSGVQALIYPNPSQGNINLVIDVLKPNGGSVQITLYNSIDQIVFQQIINNCQAQAGLKLSTVGFPKGIYYLQLRIKEKAFTKKLIIN